jgi:hypothetical protein
MPMLSPRICFFLVAVLALVNLGCGPAGPKTARVSGTITLEGKPLAKVGVTFLPPKKGPIATGNTDENGQFTLTTVRKGDGAPVGSHKVTIGAAEEGQKITNIAERYGNPHTTNLFADVKAGEKNVFTFDLKPEEPPAAKSKTGRPK